VYNPARAGLGGHTTCSAAISQGRQLPQEGWHALQAFPMHGHTGGLLQVLRLRFVAPRICFQRHGSCSGNASTGRSSHGATGSNKCGQKTLQRSEMQWWPPARFRRRNAVAAAPTPSATRQATPRAQTSGHFCNVFFQSNQSNQSSPIMDPPYHLPRNLYRKDLWFKKSLHDNNTFHFIEHNFI
jgi:hypothetical protein